MNYILIGKPNVGKSSLFNFLTSSKRNIIHIEDGTTRDWHKDTIKGTNSYIFDTPGIIFKGKNLTLIFKDLFNRFLKNKSFIFIYVIDYNEGFNQIDYSNINSLRKYDKEIILLVNKFDNFKITPSNEFIKYGMKKTIFTSCSHNYGIDEVKSLVNFTNKDKYEKDFNEHCSIAIFGKPNVGKSTFLNTLVGYERAKTSSRPRTTSDYIIDYLNYKKKKIKIIDTAGIIKKSNIKNNSLDSFSIAKTFENISFVDSAIVIIDSYEGINRQDKRIIKLISEHSKSVIIIFNKFDLIKNKIEFKKETLYKIKNTISQIKNIKVFFISSFKKNNINKIIDYLYDFIFFNNKIISTPKLNQWLTKVTKSKNHPLVNNKKVNFKFAVQIKNRPVAIKIFCNYPSKINKNYKLFLESNFNENFKIINQKTRIIFTSSENPYIN